MPLCGNLYSFSIHLLKMNDTSDFTCERLITEPPGLTEFRTVSYLYVYPAQFIVGTVTNLLNFVVLSRDEARTKTSEFLAAMSFADFFFFFAYLPVTFVGVPALRETPDYVTFWYHSSGLILWGVNWLTTTSIW